MKLEWMPFFWDVRPIFAPNIQVIFKVPRGPQETSDRLFFGMFLIPHGEDRYEVARAFLSSPDVFYAATHLEPELSRFGFPEQTFECRERWHHRMLRRVVVPEKVKDWEQGTAARPPRVSFNELSLPVWGARFEVVLETTSATYLYPENAIAVERMPWREAVRFGSPAQHELAYRIYDHLENNDLSVLSFIRAALNPEKCAFRVWRQIHFLTGLLRGLDVYHSSAHMMVKDLSGINVNAFAELFESGAPSTDFEPYIVVRIGEETGRIRTDAKEFANLLACARAKPEVEWGYAQASRFLIEHWGKDYEGLFFTNKSPCRFAEDVPPSFIT